MIQRLVKMTFQEDKIEDFLINFHKNKEKIRAFEGCKHLELWNDKKDPRIYFTYSIWTSEDALNMYRSSELFGSVWKRTKVFFSEKAQAWSVDQIFKN